jgi:hypothetical protein
MCNNCYDYANNQLTDSYSQPGLGGGQEFTSYAAGNLTAAATLDGLEKRPNCTVPLGQGFGWYVALFTGKVGDESDFHWLKQDRSGCWSHKLGTGPPIKIDGDGKAIKSPENAVLSFGGGYAVYDKFCGYFRTQAGVTIKGKESTTACLIMDWWQP